MVISEEILKQYNSSYLSFKKDEYIFYEDDQPHHYYQVIKGTVKMSSFSSNGQEFTQGIFKEGQCFGEPAIFGNFNYPNNAIAMEESVVAKLPADVFLTMLKENFEIHLKFNQIMSHRLRYKAILLKEISSYCPDHIIMTFLKYVRDNSGQKANGQFFIPYTRQQIADMTGLRVETVIRTVKQLSKERRLEIKDHKIYLGS